MELHRVQLDGVEFLVRRRNRDHRGLQVLGDCDGRLGHHEFRTDQSYGSDGFEGADSLRSGHESGRASRYEKLHHRTWRFQRNRGQRTFDGCEGFGGSRNDGGHHRTSRAHSSAIRSAQLAPRTARDPQTCWRICARASAPARSSAARRARSGDSALLHQVFTSLECTVGSGQRLPHTSRRLKRL
jgi:hypothetical protein